MPVLLRLQGRPVLLVGDGEAADAKRRLLERAGAVVVAALPPPSGGGPGWGGTAESEHPASSDSPPHPTLSPRGEGFPRLAVVALPEPDATAAELRARGFLLNVVDRPDLCDFTVPAIVDRDPVLVAIGTGGASAGLAAALRQRLEALLPAELGSLATALDGARAALRARWPDASERRRALAAALGAGGALDLLAPGDVAVWLAAADTAPPPAARLTLRSPDPDELTLREARLLSLAATVYHRPDMPPAILARARADAPRIACAAAPDPLPAGALDLGWA